MNPRPILSLDPEAGRKDLARPPQQARASKGENVVGNNVTLKLVSISAAVAVVAFTVGGWAGDLRATSSRHDAELVHLRGIADSMQKSASALENMVRSMDVRVKSLEDDRDGRFRPAR